MESQAITESPASLLIDKIDRSTSKPTLEKLVRAAKNDHHPKSRRIAAVFALNLLDEYVGTRDSLLAEIKALIPSTKPSEMVLVQTLFFNLELLRFELEEIVREEWRLPNPSPRARK